MFSITVKRKTLDRGRSRHYFSSPFQLGTDVIYFGIYFRSLPSCIAPQFASGRDVLLPPKLPVNSFTGKPFTRKKKATTHLHAQITRGKNIVSVQSINKSLLYRRYGVNVELHRSISFMAFPYNKSELVCLGSCSGLLGTSLQRPSKEMSPPCHWCKVAMYSARL